MSCCSLRRISYALLLMSTTFVVGCHRQLQVATDVYARFCNPVRIETTKPIQIEAAPVTVNTGTPIKIETDPLSVRAELIHEKKQPLQEVPVRDATSNPDQRVVVIDIDGLLVNENFGTPLTINENPVSLFREKLDHIADDPSVRAIVLRVNSPGGGVTASDIMRRDLQRFQTRHQIPVVACVMDVGAGGAYYVATAANEIYAHPTSLVGGIGVILNLYNLEDMMGFFNVVSRSVKAGKNADLGTPVRAEMSAENRALLQEIADEFHGRFIEVVRNARGGMFNDEQMLDGRVCTAPEAQKRGLVDSIGYLDDAITRAEELGNCAGASVVMLHRSDDAAKTAYDVLLQDGGSQFSFFPNIPGVQRSRLPTFLYIWQADPSLTAELGG